MTQTLIDARALFERLSEPDLCIVDCSFSLQDPEAGPAAYAKGHVPGAVYAHLNHDLSGPIVSGKTGRHPLPNAHDFGAYLERSGIGNASRVVAYDDSGGSMAARLWWLLRWVGHDAVWVLDGGLPAWTAHGFPLSAESVTPIPQRFGIALRGGMVASIEEVDALRLSSDHRLLDARAPERYRGEVEPIDRVAGHIPGARSLPFADNLREGRFLPASELRARFETALAGVPPERAVVYCGSGVTAAHHVLASEHAGLLGLRLYAGSYSEWIADGTRPVAKGSSP